MRANVPAHREPRNPSTESPSASARTRHWNSSHTGRPPAFVRPKDHPTIPRTIRQSFRRCPHPEGRRLVLRCESLVYSMDSIQLRLFGPNFCWWHHVPKSLCLPDAPKYVCQRRIHPLQYLRSGIPYNNTQSMHPCAWRVRIKIALALARNSSLHDGGAPRMAGGAQEEVAI